MKALHFNPTLRDLLKVGSRRIVKTALDFRN
jgi:hypothetical protein